MLLLLLVLFFDCIYFLIVFNCDIYLILEKRKKFKKKIMVFAKPENALKRAEGKHDREKIYMF